MDNNDELNKLSQKINQQRDALEPKVKPRSVSKDGKNIAIELIAGILVPPFIGYHIDNYADTTPLFLIIFLFCGFIGSFYNVYRLSQNMGAQIGHSPLQSEKKDGKTKQN